MTTYTGTSGDDTISGGNGVDTIYGGDGNDIISGGNGVDALFGEGGNDQLTGDNGADDLTGGAGDDVIDGSNGFDTAYYSGPIDEYSFFSAAGYLHILHLGGAGADGHDRVINVERLVFADRVIDIGSGKNAPVAGDDHVFINEDTGTYSSGAGSVLNNDFDFDGDPLTVSGGTFTGTYGTLTLNANGTYSYTLFASVQGLDDGENVTDSFNYTVSDNDGSDTGTLVFHIAGLNDAPVANDDTASTTEDAAVSGNVLANDTDVDVEPLVVANPGTYVGAYGTLVLAANGSYTYTPNAAAQALDDGEVVNDAFSYTASDGTASDTATLTVTVNGANDAPVANDDTASTTEDAASVSGNVLTNDTDVDGEPLTVANPGTYVGTYGTLTLAANGSYTYTPGAAAQGLDTGEVGQDVFTYTASDGTASDTATLTVSVNGLNDAPVANDDTAATDENTSVSGNVLANDTDVDVETLTVTNPGTYIGAYGTLVLAANGSYTYTPTGAAQALTEGQVVNDVFNYTASDGTVSDAATLTVTVTGLGGVPHANDDTASTTEDASVSGNVLTNDTDDENDPLTVSNPGTYVGTYGTLTLGANGSYTYTPNANADGLAAGESAQDVFTYTATDGTGSDNATLTVTVNGTNDAPTIDAGGTDASGSVSELPDGDPNEGTAVHSDSGAVAFDDLDLSDTHSASFTPQGGGYFGTFTLDPVDQMGDSVGWDFSVSDAALESLSEGEVRTQTYTVQIDDGHGGTVTQNVTITITGAGVGTGPQTVWYIDNSAVGSANLGTQADPYTSIAAFNAAQGTLGGPQVGHTVHLLAGTGTGVYAEADGINLLGGQTLVGDANGAVRPTIEATAGDGVNVAQNNTISGLDVGNTSGADIADSGGSVGTLTISDVGTSGTGQIIDVDQGGTLNVTLNGAESLGSSGGAIDLAGVGGSFTVTGATTITGVQSGGGVDITGSSLTASLAGGGTISTGATTAVNFVGNSGALALGGGLDIVTTSGAGLNATGGGTLTVTGSGNSVTSTTGTAVTISGVTIGSAGVTLESVSVSGAANGIVLANTGAGGGFAVTGIGTTDGSGGTILNTTGRGVSVVNSHDISLANMNLTNAGTVDLDATNGGLATGDNLDTNAAIHLVSATNVLLDNLNITGGAEQGINGNNVTNFALLNSSIAGVGNASDEDGIHFYNMLGTGRIVNTTIAGSGDDNLNLQMQSGNLDLHVSGGNVSTAVLGSGYLFGIRGTAIANINLENVTSQNNTGGGIVADAFDNATMNVRVAGSTSSGNNDQLSVSAGDNSQVDLDATGNILTSGTGDFTVVTLAGSAFDTGYVFDARLNGNTITTGNGVTADGVVVTNPGGGTMNVAITDNIVSYAGTTRAILLQEGQDGNGTLRATVTGNAIDILLDGAGNAANGILAQNALVGPGNTSHMDLNIGGAGSLANTFTHSLGGVLAGGDIRVRQRNDGTVNLDGYGGLATDTTAVNAYLNGRNNEVSSSTSTVQTVGFTGNASPTFITVTVSAVSVDEDGGTNLVYTFTRSGSTAASLIADFAVTGTADSADFTLSGATSYSSGTGHGTVTFSAGSATTQIIVDPTADGILEFAESVVVDAGNSATANGSFAHAFITNDDAGMAMMMAIPAGGGPLAGSPEWLL
ncbi:MAG TPA: Ig-like domain-containing protein [Allosphingosinicella sp.]|nr:Ig-like domain-containing protein [Allosphingosinicella sp.]